MGAGLTRWIAALLVAAGASVAMAQPAPFGAYAGAWRLEEAGGQARTGAEITIAPDGTLSGSGGCNRIGATLRSVRGQVRVGPVRATRMACEAPRMAVESAVLASLERAADLDREGDVLLVRSNRGEVTSRWRLAGSTAPAPGAGGGGLEGVDWRLADAAAGSSPVRIRFSAGRFTATGPCNTLAGNAPRAGSRLAVRPVQSTMRACLTPDGSDPEQAFLDALSRVASWSRTGNRLVLQDAAGRTLLEFERTSS